MNQIDSATVAFLLNYMYWYQKKTAFIFIDMPGIWLVVFNPFLTQEAVHVAQ